MISHLHECGFTNLPFLKACEFSRVGHLPNSDYLKVIILTFGDCWQIKMPSSNGKTTPNGKSAGHDLKPITTEILDSNDKMSPIDIADEADVDTRCGYSSSCKPAWLQMCANPKAYLFVASLCSIVQGMVNRGRCNVAAW